MAPRSQYNGKYFCKGGVLVGKWRDIRAMLLDVVARHETAVVFHEKRDGFYQTVSYGRLLEDVAALDTVLGAHLARGTRVLLLARDGRLRTTVLLALLVGGYPAVLVTGKQDTATLAATAIRAGVGAVIYDADATAHGETLAAYLPTLSMTEISEGIKAGRAAIKAGEIGFLEAPLDSKAPAIVFCGRNEPVFSQDAVLTAVEAFVEAQGITEADIFLSTLPADTKDAVLLGLLAPLFVGASVAFGEGIGALMANMREVHPTTLLTVPYIADKIHDKFFALVAENGTEPAVRRAIAASDPVRPLAARQMLKERLLLSARAPFGGALRRILVLGGQLSAVKTKGLRQIGIHAAAIYTVPFLAGVASMTVPQDYCDGTVGKVIRPVSVSLTAPRADGAGEISLCGKALACGYSDGCLTGDIAKFDAEGNLCLIGRVVNRIPLAGGDFVCPEALEAGLKQSPLVADAAVFALPTGELAALIYPNYSGIEEMLGEAYSEDEMTYVLDEWIGELNRTLPISHSIVQFALAEEPLPRNKTGKLQRGVLAELFRT